MKSTPIYIPGYKQEIEASKTSKQLEREHIEKETAKFLASGKQVTVCECGLTGDRALKKIKTNNYRGLNNL